MANILLPPVAVSRPNMPTPMNQNELFVALFIKTTSSVFDDMY